METVLRGVFPVIPTPFCSNLEVDYEGLRRVVDFCIKCGAHGFLTTAMASEFYTLTDEEHEKVVEVIIEQTAGRVPVVVGIAARSTAHGLMFAKHAQACGADAVSSTPPVVESVLGRVHPSKISEYFKNLDRAIDIPIFIQNAPELGGMLTAEEMMRLANDCEHVLYTKEEGKNSQQVASRMMEIAKTMKRGTFRGVFAGGGGFSILSDMKRGTNGIMPSCATTDIYVDIWEKFHNGDEAGASALHRLLVPAQLYERIYWNAYAKRVLLKRGVIACDAIRETCPLLDEHGSKEVDRVFSVMEGAFRV